MKKLGIGFLIGIIALAFCFNGVVYAQESSGFSETGITPDNPLYYMNKWSKQISMFLTYRHDLKVEKALEYAEERLAEMDYMLARNRYEEANRINNEYQYCMTVANRSMEKARVNSVNTSEKAAFALSNHIEHMNKNIAAASDNACMVLTQTRECARNCQETALKIMAKGDPEKAAQTQLMLMEQHLDRIRVRVEEHKDVALLQELGEYERLGKLGEGLLQIAEEKGKGTAVCQLIGQSTSYHLQVLTNVHQQVQEQSRQSVESAMRICVENHERIVTQLKAQNMLGQIPEEPPLPEDISDNVRQRISSRESSNK